MFAFLRENFISLSHFINKEFHRPERVPQRYRNRNDDLNI
jgi:hypothetical protein